MFFPKGVNNSRLERSSTSLCPTYSSNPKVFRLSPTMAKNLEELDQDGDFILVVGRKSEKRHFLVSSKIPSFVSLPFKDILAWYSLPKALAKDEPPREIFLPDDHPGAMSILLQILHYQWTEQTLPISVKRLAILAFHCHKYKCIKAFQPWITHLFTICLKLTTQKYGLLLLAAHFEVILSAFGTGSARVTPSSNGFRHWRGQGVSLKRKQMHHHVLERGYHFPTLMTGSYGLRRTSIPGGGGCEGLQNGFPESSQALYK